MSAPHPSDDMRVQAIIYASVYTDAAAARQFSVTTRSLRKWRAELRRGDTTLSETFRRYSAALRPEIHADDFMGWMQRQVREVSAVFIEKAREVNPNNPEGLRAISEHAGWLLEASVALAYISRLFSDPGAPIATNADSSADSAPE